MTDGPGCGCAKCRVARGEIPAGPYTPGQFLEYGLQPPQVVSSNPVSEAVRADPDVIAAREAVRVAEVAADVRRREWEEACVAVARAELVGREEASRRSSLRRPGDDSPIFVNPGGKTRAEWAREEAREALELAGRALVKARERERTAATVARHRFVTAQQAASAPAASAPAEPVRRSPMFRRG